MVAPFLKGALADKAIEIWGDGRVIGDGLHIADVADAVAAAQSDQGNATTFNIGSGSGTSLNALVRTLSEVLGKGLEVIHRAGRRFDLASNVHCCQRVRNELRWYPQSSLAEG